MRSHVQMMVGIGAAGIAMALAGCSDTHGVSAFNDTDQVLHVEMLTVNALGESSVYSTATVNRNGTFENRMDSSVRGQVMRARFTIEGQGPEEDNWVMLNLPDKGTRHFTLRLEGGRLRAVEDKKKQK